MRPVRLILDVEWLKFEPNLLTPKPLRVAARLASHGCAYIGV